MQKMIVVLALAAATSAAEEPVTSSNTTTNRPRNEIFLVIPPKRTLLDEIDIRIERCGNRIGTEQYFYPRWRLLNRRLEIGPGGTAFYPTSNSGPGKDGFGLIGLARWNFRKH